MLLELQNPLVEEAVFLSMKQREGEPTGEDGARDPSPGKLFREFRERLDAAYELPPGEESREDVFRAIHADFFSRLGFAELLQGVLRELPLLAEKLDRLSLLLAAGRKEEGAELMVRPARRPGGTPHLEAILGLRAERFLEPDKLGIWLLKELYHVFDMLDPAFGYRPTLGEHVSKAREGLVRDRFGVLWSCHIDARLSRAEKIPESCPALHRPALERLFRAEGEQAVSWILGRLRSGASLTYGDLLAWARGEFPRGAKAMDT